MGDKKAESVSAFDCERKSRALSRTGLRFEVPSGELFHRLGRQPRRYALACRHEACPH